ncbi:MAG: hypothetical protein MJ137_07160 [Clostridia bacterium]|nr:hypothetical protein [Clostridia bacterium]
MNKPLRFASLVLALLMFAAAFIQVLGDYSYNLTRPVIFEETMKAKYKSIETKTKAINEQIKELK